MRLILLIISGILSLFYSAAVFAASTCYSEDYFPSVVKIEETDNGFRVNLGGKFHRDIREKTLSSDTTLSLVYIDTDGWKAGETVPCKGTGCINWSDWIRQCGGVEMPEIVLP